jgi:hypothetical protein
MSKEHRHHFGIENILLTTGAMQGLDLIGKVLIDPGDLIVRSSRPISARSTPGARAGRATASWTGIWTIRFSRCLAARQVRLLGAQLFQPDRLTGAAECARRLAVPRDRGEYLAG